MERRSGKSPERLFYVAGSGKRGCDKKKYGIKSNQVEKCGDFWMKSGDFSEKRFFSAWRARVTDVNW